MNRNPCLFIVGCPRSGTTLLQRMLHHHPQLAVANDTHFIPRAIEELAPAAARNGTGEFDLPLTPALVDWVRHYHRFHRFKLSPEHVASAAEHSTFIGFTSALYSEFAKVHGKPLAGEKTPDYVRHLPLLHQMFPHVKTVHIIRDGRDVVLSTLNWAREGKGPRRFELWQGDSVAVCGLWWQWQVRQGRRDGQRLGPTKYCEVRYEQLVSRPEQTLRAITDFAGLPFAEEMLDYFKTKPGKTAKPSTKSHRLPPTPGLRDWRTQMPEQDVEVLEALVGDLLADLGYDRSVQRISPDTTRMASICRSWWLAELQRRQTKSAYYDSHVEPSAAMVEGRR